MLRLNDCEGFAIWIEAIIDGVNENYDPWRVGMMLGNRIHQYACVRQVVLGDNRKKGDRGHLETNDDWPYDIVVCQQMFRGLQTWQTNG